MIFSLLAAFLMFSLREEDREKKRKTKKRNKKEQGRERKKQRKRRSLVYRRCFIVSIPKGWIQ